MYGFSTYTSGRHVGSGNMVPHRGIDKVPADTAAGGGFPEHTEYSDLLWVLSGWFLFWQKAVLWVPVKRCGIDIGNNYRGLRLSDGGWLSGCFFYAIGSSHLYVPSVLDGNEGPVDASAVLSPGKNTPLLLSFEYEAGLCPGNLWTFGEGKNR
jgi:hypothetical protein